MENGGVNPEKQGINRTGGPPETLFRKGVSGNPGGRPKGSVSIGRHMRELLTVNDQEKAKALAQVLLDQACAGNLSAIKEIVGRMDGPAGAMVDENIDLSQVSDEDLEILERISRAHSNS